jgi:hypothetical protein
MPRFVLALLLILIDAVRADAQDEPRLFAYARLGVSAVKAVETHRAPAAGFGLRTESDSADAQPAVLCRAFIGHRVPGPWPRGRWQPRAASHSLVGPVDWDRVDEAVALRQTILDVDRRESCRPDRARPRRN